MSNGFGECGSGWTERNHYTGGSMDEMTRAANAAQKPAWSQDWPTEPGWYWFWGVDYRQYVDTRPITDADRRLIMVHASTYPGGMTYWGDGRFLYKTIEAPANVGAVGVWQRATAPDLPTT